MERKKHMHFQKLYKKNANLIVREIIKNNVIIIIGILNKHHLFKLLPIELKEMIYIKYVEECMPILNYKIISNKLMLFDSYLKSEIVWFSGIKIEGIYLSFNNSKYNERYVRDTVCQVEGCICPPIQSTNEMYFYCSIHLPEEARWNPRINLLSYTV